VSSYYEALKRIPTRAEQPQGRRDTTDEASDSRSDVRTETRVRSTSAIVPLPTVEGLPISVARAEALQRLTERLAPLAMTDGSMRLLISGCRPADGVSTLASAFAIDLSQRLLLRTLLVDAHMRHPSLHRIFALPESRQPELVLDGAVQLRSSGWPRLELANCYLDDSDKERYEVLERFGNVLSHYSAVVVDLGVIRLDTRMLPLARPADPILLVARYGHTRKQELATTAAALRAANRAVAGVILNAATSPVAKTLRKLTKHE
jgi:Mrp family chromosome partitioning ATPase